MITQQRSSRVSCPVVIMVLMGAPGAGKGTQAGLVAEQLEAVHVATGDLFRSAIESGTPPGLKAKGFVERGELVPDEITVAIVLDRLRQPDVHAGVVFDGFPRNLAQAVALDVELARLGSKVDLAVNIEVPSQVLVDRLSGRRVCRSCQAPYHLVNSPPAVPGCCDRCGGELYVRDDDRSETVERRLAVYLESTRPLLEYYAERGVLTTVNGAQTISAVREDMLCAVGDFLRPVC